MSMEVSADLESKSVRYIFCEKYQICRRASENNEVLSSVTPLAELFKK